MKAEKAAATTTQPSADQVIEFLFIRIYLRSSAIWVFGVRR